MITPPDTSYAHALAQFRNLRRLTIYGGSCYDQRTTNWRTAAYNNQIVVCAWMSYLLRRKAGAMLEWVILRSKIWGLEDPSAGVHRFGSPHRRRSIPRSLVARTAYIYEQAIRSVRQETRQEVITGHEFRLRSKMLLRFRIHPQEATLNRPIEGSFILCRLSQVCLLSAG